MAATESTRTQLATWLTALASGAGNPIITVGASFTQGVGATQDGAHGPMDLLRIAVANRNSKAVGVGWLPAYSDWGLVGGISFWPYGWGFATGGYPTVRASTRPTLRANSAGWSVDYAAGGQTPIQSLTCTRLDGYFDTVASGGGSAQLFVDTVAFGSPVSVNAGATRESGHKLITWTAASPSVPETHTFQWKFTTNPVTFNGAHVASSDSFDVINLAIGGTEPSSYNPGGTYDRGIVDFIRVNAPSLVIFDLEENAALLSNKTPATFQSDATTLLTAIRAATAAPIVTTHDPLTDAPPSTYDAPQSEIWTSLWKPALKAAGDAITAPRAAVFDAAAIIGDLSGNVDPHGYLNAGLDSLHLDDAGYAAWETGLEYTVFMATTSDPRTVNATFTGTTVDTALLTQFWDTVTIANADATNRMWVRFDNVDPVAGAEGAYAIETSQSRTFNIRNSAGVAGSTTPATACHNIRLLGNGGSYSVTGNAANSAQGSAGGSSGLAAIATNKILANATGASGLPVATALEAIVPTAATSWPLTNGQVVVTNGTASDGSVNIQVAHPGFAVANIGIKSAAGDAANALNFGTANGSPFISTTPPGGTVGTTNPSNVALWKTISKSQTDTGTATGAEADLFTDTLTAAALGANSDAIEVKYAGGVLATGGTTKRVRVYFGGTVVWDSTALVIAGAGFWSVEVLVQRTSASVVNIYAQGVVSGPATSVSFPQLVKSVTGLTLANAQIIKVTGQSAGGSPAANDVVGSTKQLFFIPAT